MLSPFYEWGNQGSGRLNTRPRSHREECVWWVARKWDRCAHSWKRRGSNSGDQQVEAPNEAPLWGRLYNSCPFVVNTNLPLAPLDISLHPYLTPMLLPCPMADLVYPTHPPRESFGLAHRYPLAAFSDIIRASHLSTATRTTSSWPSCHHQTTAPACCVAKERLLSPWPLIVHLLPGFRAPLSPASTVTSTIITSARFLSESSIPSLYVCFNLRLKPAMS